VSEEEPIETITHLAFYADWPNAVAAVAVARQSVPAKLKPLLELAWLRSNNRPGVSDVR